MGLSTGMLLTSWPKGREGSEEVGAGKIAFQATHSVICLFSISYGQVIYITIMIQSPSKIPWGLVGHSKCKPYHHIWNPQNICVHLFMQNALIPSIRPIMSLVPKMLKIPSSKPFLTLKKISLLGSPGKDKKLSTSDIQWCRVSTTIPNVGERGIEMGPEYDQSLARQILILCLCPATRAKIWTLKDLSNPTSLALKFVISHQGFFC